VTNKKSRELEFGSHEIDGSPFMNIITANQLVDSRMSHEALREDSLDAPTYVELRNKAQSGVGLLPKTKRDRYELGNQSLVFGKPNDYDLKVGWSTRTRNPSKKMTIRKNNEDLG